MNYSGLYKVTFVILCESDSIILFTELRQIEIIQKKNKSNPKWLQIKYTLGKDTASHHLLPCKSYKGENESDPHWVYCSKFLLAGLCHLMMCLGQLNEKNFLSPLEYQHMLNTTNLLVRKAEMVFSSHLAYWSALRSSYMHTVVENNYVHVFKYYT